MSPRFTAKLYQASSLLCLAGIAIPATGIAEIVITANKREEESSKVGLTIQAIGDMALEQQHVTTLQDVANAVPGLTFTETENSTPVYTLRGVGLDRKR